MSAIVEISRTRNPFSRTGIHVDERGIPRNATLPDSLVGMPKASADASPGAEAIVEIGGSRLSYKQGKLLKAKLRSSVRWGVPLR